MAKELVRERKILVDGKPLKFKNVDQVWESAHLLRNKLYAIHVENFLYDCEDFAYWWTLQPSERLGRISLAKKMVKRYEKVRKSLCYLYDVIQDLNDDSKYRSVFEVFCFINSSIQLVDRNLRRLSILIENYIG